MRDFRVSTWLLGANSVPVLMSPVNEHEYTEIEIDTFDRRVQDEVRRATIAAGEEIGSEWATGYAEGFRAALERVDDQAGVTFNLDSSATRRVFWVTDTIRFGSMNR